RAAGSPIVRCTVAGGGTRSNWWMQLKADLLGIPVGVPRHDEPGTFGAALLAGVGLGTYASFIEAADRVAMARRFEPDAARAAAFASKVRRHRDAAELLLGAGRGRRRRAAPRLGAVPREGGGIPGLRSGVVSGGNRQVGAGRPEPGGVPADGADGVSPGDRGTPGPSGARRPPRRAGRRVGA